MLTYKVPAWQQSWSLMSSLLQLSPLISACPEGQGLQERVEPLPPPRSLLKSWGERAKVVSASCLHLPSMCCQYWLRNRFPLRLAGSLHWWWASAWTNWARNWFGPDCSCWKGPVWVLLLELRACYRSCWIPVLSWGLPEVT